MHVFSTLAAGVLALGLFPAGSSLAMAFEKFEEYRIVGTEIASVDLVAPGMAEDPHLFTIHTVNEEAIELEADNEVTFMENCRDAVERVIGNSTAYIQIVILANAQTMNGSLFLQCTDLPFSIPAE